MLGMWKYIVHKAWYTVYIIQYEQQFIDLQVLLWIHQSKLRGFVRPTYMSLWDWASAIWATLKDIGNITDTNEQQSLDCVMFLGM